MTAESVNSPELLAAEIAALEDLLMNYEDWRAWAQLEARERLGELPPSVVASGLKTLLLDKLAVNPLFLRRQALVKQMEQAAARAQQSRADEGDDLTRIRGIDVRLERRLNNLMVRTYTQIAAWLPADVHYFASTLGLGDHITSQMWIEQAAMLSGATHRPAVPAASVHAQPPMPSAPALPPRSTPQRADAKAAPATVEAVADPPATVSSTTVPPVQLPDPEAASSVAPAQAAKPSKAELPGNEGAKAAVKSPTQREPAREDEKPAAQSARGAPPAAAETKSQAVKTPSEAVKGKGVPVANPPTPAASAPTKVSHVEEVARAEPDYSVLLPAMPLAASAYAGYVPGPPPAVVAPATAQPISASADANRDGASRAAPSVEIAALTPAFAMAAHRYAGGAVAPPHDLPVTGASVPRPLAVHGYSALKPQNATDTQSEGQAEKAAAGAAASADKRASDILEQSLPPLPLKPAKAAEPKMPPPLSAQAAPIVAPKPVTVAAPLTATPTPSQLASVAAAAAAAAASAAKTPPTVPQQAAKAAAPAVAIKAPDEMLRVATARQQPTAATAPPPLPQGIAPAARASEPAPAPAKSVVVGEDGPPRATAPEARVSIRRSDEGPSQPVIKVPGATDIHLSRRPYESFDGAAYAAYHSEVEEASVQIVRKQPGTRPTARPATAGPSQSSQGSPIAGTAQTPPPAVRPAEPPPLTAAEAAARAAAALNASIQAAKAAAQAASSTPPAAPPSPGPSEAADATALAKKGAEKATATMGRFLKALTGQ